MENHLSRLFTVQQRQFIDALCEMKSGRKRSHRMWYIFPMIQGLWHSSIAMTYAIKDMKEVKVYFYHPVLAHRLIEIPDAFCRITRRTGIDILYCFDDMILKAWLKLIAFVLKDVDNIFRRILKKFFGIEVCLRTSKVLYIASLKL